MRRRDQIVRENALPALAGRNRAARRSAFTLLEVLLAAAIGVVLLAALYTAMSVQLQHAQAARQVVEQGNLVRAIVARLGNDVTSNLGPQNVGSTPDNSSASAGPPAAASSGTGTSGAASSSTSSGSSGGTAGGTGASTPSVTTNSQVSFNLGVQGDTTHLTLYTSRVPREVIQAQQTGTVDPVNPLGISDLRRISYWLVDGAGLARQEVYQVTSDDVMNAVPPNIPDEANYVIAEEVKSLGFSYFDGTSWQDTWDGTAIGADGQTPIGPPLAIAINLAIAQPGTQNVKNYRHVVFIPMANGVGQPSQQ